MPGRFKSIGGGLAAGTEVTGVALLMLCSFVDPPFTSTEQGPAQYVRWEQAGCSACAGFYSVDVNDSTFDMNGPIQPAGPGPYEGETVLVTYQDLARGVVVLSLTTSPGMGNSIMYTTSDYPTYLQSRPLGYLAMAGLLVGAVLTLGGALFLFLAGRRSRAPAGGLSATFAPLCLLGGVALLSFASGQPGAGITPGLTTVLWLLSAAGALTSGLVSRKRHERPETFASYGLLGAGTVSAVWTIWTIGVLLHNLSTIS